MSIAVIITDRNSDDLCQQIQQALPGVVLQQWPNIPQPEQVKLAVLWNHPKGVTDDMTALEMVVSMGAGMDHIDADDHIPSRVCRDRIVTLALKQNMAQYVLQHVLNDHRHFQAYQQQQNKQQWQVLEDDTPLPTVGFLGLGELGGFVADQCHALGFNTHAWTVTQKHPKHPCHHGRQGLQHVCENSQYLVILLPMTEQTKGIINSETLAWCHSDCTLINVGRGGHVVEQDLLVALDQGLIKAAVLDVFETEPLPVEHPFWSHPKIRLTPHSSSRSDVLQTAAQVVHYYQNL